jgi:hypothetical protein
LGHAFIFTDVIYFTIYDLFLGGGLKRQPENNNKSLVEVF